MAIDLMAMFDERFAQCETYLDFIEGVDDAIKRGVPRIGGRDGLVISTDQQRILYSVVYLHLYNLVEATVTACLESISKTAISDGNWKVHELSTDMRKEWVKHIARTNLETNADNRLTDALVLCEHLVASLPVGPFDIKAGGGGNWNDDEISKIAKRIGFTLRLKRSSLTGIKKPVRDEMGAMKLIMIMRNRLAHGSISFVECSQNDTPTDLRDLSKNVGAYLRDVVTSFSQFIAEHKFLLPEARPQLAV